MATEETLSPFTPIFHIVGIEHGNGAAPAPFVGKGESGVMPCPAGFGRHMRGGDATSLKFGFM
jgi:hypothetical protein